MAKRKYTTEELIKKVSLGGGASLLAIGLVISMVGSRIVGIMFLILAVIIGVVPFSIYQYFKFNKYAKMEEQFPRFMKDFSESVKGGMGFPQALDMAAKTDYGALSPEVLKASNQVSWGMPFPKAMKKFAERLKGSKVMRQSFALVNEAFVAGGNVADIMESIAENIGAIRNIEDERKSAMSQQVFIMYFIYIMFLGIIVALYKLLIPMISVISSAEAGDMFGGGTPLDSCSVVPLLCGMGEAIGFTGDHVYFKTLFFCMSIVQGISSGILAGTIGEGKVVAGTKHAVILVIAAMVVFIMFI